MTTRMNYNDLPEVPDQVHSKVLQTLEQIQGEGDCRSLYGSKVVTMHETDTHSGRTAKRGRTNKRRTAAIAALVAAALGTTVFAAVNYWGLGDFLENAGLRETEKTAGIIQTVSGTAEFSNDYADYTVREALRDGTLLYLVVEAQPKDGYLLVPEDYDETSPVSWLSIAEDDERSIGEYAQSLGKTILRGGMSMSYDGEPVTATRDARLYEDGSLYFCLTGNVENTTSDDLDLTVTGIVIDPEDSAGAVSASGTCSVQNAETIEEKTPEISLPAELENAGLKLQTVTLRETALGLYADLAWQAAGQDVETATEALKEAEEEAASDEEEDAASAWSFSLADADGQDIESMPYYSGSGITVSETDGGTMYSQTLSYQCSADETPLNLKITNTRTGEETLIGID